MAGNRLTQNGITQNRVIGNGIIQNRARPPVFPFTAVLGQEKIKKALIWIIINPRIGGLLIAGEKGTAKSTLIRASRTLACGRRIV
ncbi:MAG: hypothetical protein LBF77_04250, partial [Spirochaetaceae bacterium]|nr:hypothetical protein [Spirochaetaceae bacterium]